MEPIALIIGAIALALYLLRPKWSAPTVKPIDRKQLGDFAVKPSLFVNGPERAMYHALTRNCPPGYAVMSKPRMEDVVGPRKGLPRQYSHGLRGRVKSRHFDFLVIDAAGRPIAAIEVDGAAHNNRVARLNDEVKTSICAGAGLALHRVRVGEDFARFSQQLFTALPRLKIAS